MQESARALRSAVRQNQAETGYLSLFHALASDCFEKGWSPEIAKRLLSETCANVGTTRGLFAKLNINTLEVIASIGDSYPQAARIPLMGQLASLLKSPCKYAQYRNILTLAPHKNDMTDTTVTFPIAYNSRPIGIMVLALPSNTLNDSQNQLCKAVCGLLGVILYQTDAKQAQSSKDLSIIDALTPREREVFALLPSGKSNAELGTLLGIATGTVKIHVERVLNKLGVNDRTQAAVKAVELGFSSSDYLTD